MRIVSNLELILVIIASYMESLFCDGLSLFMVLLLFSFHLFCLHFHLLHHLIHLHLILLRLIQLFLQRYRYLIMPFRINYLPLLHLLRHLMLILRHLIHLDQLIAYLVGLNLHLKVAEFSEFLISCSIRVDE